ncbi:glycosyltransferase, partial [bacterium]|nr:glycosyltransferase [bacterium]
KNIYSVSRKQNIIRRYYNYVRLVWQWSTWADIIYTLDLVSVGLPVAIVKLLRPDIKIVTRLGGDFLWEKALNKEWYDNTLRNYYQERKFNFTEKLIFKINKFVLDNTDFIILNAFILRNVFISQLGIKKEKIKVIKNVRNSGYLPDNDNIRQENNILSIGRLSQLKNIIRLIDAFALLLKKRDDPGLCLDIVGEGPIKEKIINKIKSLNLENRIKLLPRLSHDEALKKIKAAKIIALPSLTEINAYTVNEAQALGKRIVLSQESESFICHDAYNKLWYVDPLSTKDIADKLMMALDNIPEQTRSIISEIKLDEDKQITWDRSKVIARHIEVFRSNL